MEGTQVWIAKYCWACRNFAIYVAAEALYSSIAKHKILQTISKSIIGKFKSIIGKFKSIINSVSGYRWGGLKYALAWLLKEN